MTSSKTSDGFSWAPESGTRKGGLVCKGVISPPSQIHSGEAHIYDAIIVGAGYAGLVAARNLATGGRSVLLLEARDRVGGRTYTVESDDGFTYEMGGTWVTHFMPHLFLEMIRYKMDRNLTTTRLSGYENDYYTINVPGVAPRRLSHEEAGAMTARAWNLFVNVDGENCRKVCPLPHAQLDNIQVSRAEVEKWDAYSCNDRFQEIKDQLSAEEQGLLVALLLHISGGNMHNSSLWDMIRSHALISHNSDNFEEVWTTYKLKEGQSALARRMFDEAAQCGLEYAFSTPIRSVTENPNGTPDLVEVATNNGRKYHAHRVISTIPLNVLRDITFSPPLSAKRQEAINTGHVNFMTKIHAEVEGSGLASWNGMRFPGELMFGYGDGVHPNGNAHIVGFGKDERDTFVPERHPEKVVAAFKALHPMEVKKTIFHNWNTDPYSQAGPAWWPPSFMTKYQDELQSRHGNVFFASADWAHGWRASIDGALEQGTITSQEVVKELRQLDKMKIGKNVSSRAKL